MSRYDNLTVPTDRTRPTLGDRLGVHIPSWTEDAVCAQADPDAFYPDKGGSSMAVKRLCNGDPAAGTDPCPVRTQCLEQALRTNEAWGIWGGTSERDRRALRQQRNGAA